MAIRKQTILDEVVFSTGTSTTGSGDKIVLQNSPTIFGTLTVDQIIVSSPGSGDTDGATRGYVDSSVRNLTFKSAVRAATTGNITLSGEQTIDGVSCVTGDRVLVKDQGTASQNGIYVVAAGAWSRSADADSDSEFKSGTILFVTEGSTNADNGFMLSTNDPITVGSTSLVFTSFTGLGAITAGSGMSKSGNTLNVGTASASRIVVNADDIDLANSGVTPGTYTKITVDTYGRATVGASATTSDIGEGSNLYYTDARVRSAVSGTTNRISFNSGTGVFDIDSAYVGQTSITTLGTIGVGTWEGTEVSAEFGGTGFGTYTAGDLLYASGATALSKLGIGTNGHILMVQSGLPAWVAQTSITSLGTITVGTWNGTAIGTTYGGTGLTSIGTANQMLGVNSGASALEYKSISGTSNQVTVSHGAGSITLSTPQNIHSGATPTFAGLTLSGLSTSQAIFTDGTGVLVSNAITGTGNVVMSASPTLTGTIVAANMSMSGDLTLSGDPSSALHAATKQYVDAVATGLDVKASVRAATTGSITLSGTQTIDDVSCIAGDRVLVKNQGTASENGIYVVSAGAWSRSADADNSPAGEVTSGMFTFVTEGTVNGNNGFVLTTDDPITLDSTSLSFAQFSGAGQITAGAGLTKSGNTIDVVSTGGGSLTITADSINLTSGIVSPGTYTKLTVDTYGRVTAGTDIAASDINTALGLSSSLAVFTNGSGQLTTNAITGSGSVVMSTNPTFDSEIFMSATNARIQTNTSDGSDNKRLQLSGGGGPSTARGSYINAYGNEYDSVDGGTLRLIAGAVNTSATTGRVIISTNGTDRITVDYGGGVTISSALALSSTLTVGDGTATATSYINGAAGQTRDLIYRTNGSNRWVLRTSSGAESGSNAGSAFQIISRDDAGSQIDVAFEITRASGGTLFINRPVTSSSLHTAQGGTLYNSNQSSAQGKIHYGTSEGLTVRGIAGSTNDFTLYSADAGTLIANPTGTRNLTVGHSSGNVSIPGTISVTGLQSNSEGISFIANGSSAAGKIFRTAVSGLVIRGVTGSSYDFVLRSADDGSNVFQVPTGTGNIVFPGTLAVTGQSAFTGSIGIGGSANSDIGLRLVQSTFGSGTSQYGSSIDPTFNSSATSNGIALEARVKTAVASFTMTSAMAVRILKPTKGAGSSITNAYGLKVEDQDQGTFNYAIFTGAGLVQFGDNVTLTTSKVGSTVQSAILNTDNTNTASHGRVLVQSGGSSGGDPFLSFAITGSDTWSVGLDNSDSDAFVISQSATLGTNNYLRIASGGVFQLNIQDNAADAFDLQQGANNYINVNTSNGSENVSFGNGSTNPSYSFLGTGQVTISGNISLSGATAADRILITNASNQITTTGGLTYATGGIVGISGRLNIGGATDNATFALNVSGGSIGVSGSNSILSYGSGVPGDANYERASVVHTGSAAEFRSQASGTGTVEPLRLVVGSTTRYDITDAGVHTVTGTVSMSSTLTVTGNFTASAQATVGTRLTFTNTPSAFQTGSSQSWIYGSTNSSSDPFNESGHLILQSASTANRDILFVTGSTPTTRMRIDETNTVVSTNMRVSSGNLVVGSSTATFTSKAFTVIGSGFDAACIQLENTAVDTVTNGRAFNLGITTVSGSSGRLDLTLPGVLTALSVHSGGNISIGSTTSAKLVTLEVIGGTAEKAGILLATNLANSANKEGRLKSAHYTNAEEPVTMIWGSNQSSSNAIYIGGNSSAENAATSIDFYTAANNTTTNGTRRGGFNSSGNFDLTGSLILGSISTPGSPSSGQMWNDSTRNSIVTFVSGVNQALSTVLWTKTANTTIANTTTETTMLDTGVGTKTLPANFFTVGKTIRFRIYGLGSTTGFPNMRVRVKLGSTVIIDTTPNTWFTSVGGSPQVFEGEITCRTTGGSGTVIGRMNYQFNASSGQIINSSTTTVDTTASQAFDIMWTWDTANASNTATFYTSYIEVLN